MCLSEQKKEFGQVMNAFKQFAEEKYETLKSAIGNSEVPATRILISACPVIRCPLAAGTL